MCSFRGGSLKSINLYLLAGKAKQQLGGQYKNVHEFSRDCRTHIIHIKAIRPDLSISFI